MEVVITGSHIKVCGSNDNTELLIPFICKVTSVY